MEAMELIAISQAKKWWITICHLAIRDSLLRGETLVAIPILITDYSAPTNNCVAAPSVSDPSGNTYINIKQSILPFVNPEPFIDHFPPSLPLLIFAPLQDHPHHGYER